MRWKQSGMMGKVYDLLYVHGGCVGQQIEFVTGMDVAWYGGLGYMTDMTVAWNGGYGLLLTWR